MGNFMVRNLLTAGYTCSIYDINPDALNELGELGAKVVATVGEVAAGSDAVITMLPNSAVVQSVVLGPEGLLQAMSTGTYIVDMSSSYILDTVKLSEVTREHGVTLMDAPVSGGAKGAREATLTIMVGGHKEDYEKILPILQCMGKNIRHVGESGHGHALKAINNYLSAASLYATTEAMMMAHAVGLNLETCLDVVNDSSGQSYSTHYKFPNFVLPRTFDTGFPLDLLLKDVKMATSIARDNHVPILLGAAVEQIYEAARQMLGPGKDHTEVVRFLENLTGEVLSK